MDDKEVHSANAPAPIDSTVPGIVIVVSEVHTEKVRTPIFFKPLCIFTDVSELHSANA